MNVGERILIQNVACDTNQHHQTRVHTGGASFKKFKFSQSLKFYDFWMV